MAKKKFPYAETLVGAFILSGLIVLFLMILFVGSKQNLLEGRFKVQAIFSRVGGLRVDSPVRLAGIEVGNVEDLRFNGQGKIVVTMSIQQRYREQIRKDSLATIGSVGLLGDRTVEIKVGSPDAEIAPPGSVLPSQDAFEITEVLDQIGPAIEDAKKIMANVATVTEKLKSQGNTLSSAMDHANEILEKVNTGKGTLGALISDPTLYQQVTDLLGNSKKVVSRLEVAAQRIEGLTTQLSKLTPNLQTTMNNFQESSAYIKESSAALKESLEQVPTLVKKGDKILDNVVVTSENIRKASSNIPEIVHTGQEAVDGANKVMEAAQKHWLLRGYVNREESAKVITMDKRDQPYPRETPGSLNRPEPVAEKAKKSTK
jgi:phospholipid/cholesterol/gamma-HCH transport system substrate-binding protein